MRLLLISLLLVAQGATAREAVSTDPTSRPDALATSSVQGQPAATFTPIDASAISPELNAKLELKVNKKLKEEGRRQDLLVSAN